MQHCTTADPKLLAIMIAAAIVSSFSLAKLPPSQEDTLHKELVELKQVVFQTLNTKCNVCHRKQNPFMVFSMRNMERRAAKIYKQVFIVKRMPKGDQIKLSTYEYATLKQWLLTQNIN